MLLLKHYGVGIGVMSMSAGANFEVLAVWHKYARNQLIFIDLRDIKL